MEDRRHPEIRRRVSAFTGRRRRAGTRRPRYRDGRWASPPRDRTASYRDAFAALGVARKGERSGDAEGELRWAGETDFRFFQRGPDAGPKARGRKIGEREGG